ncbi:unnamed protein product [Dovyalis caffra]|uniref:Uncharacterized protein n=1 Tax=Dovyalis caffra TaxID=77055 RepID=A0AAV1SNA7_9ROSI|nr:unnamed protein product [Dovyalis caffra]
MKDFLGAAGEWVAGGTRELIKRMRKADKVDAKLAASVIPPHVRLQRLVNLSPPYLKVGFRRNVGWHWMKLLPKKQAPLVGDLKFLSLDSLLSHGLGSYLFVIRLQDGIVYAALTNYTTPG